MPKLHNQLKRKKKFKAQLNATGVIWIPLELFNEDWISRKSVRDFLNKSDTKYSEHAVMSWTVCYNDDYFIYFNNKKDSK